jgi:ArsR family transcriptional regulator
MQQIISITKCISDKNRLRILMALSQYPELCACQITELLQVTGATVSRHLTLLTHAGLIESRKDGRWIFFRLLGGKSHDLMMTWLKNELKETPDIISDRASLTLILSQEPEDICRKQRGESCCPLKKTNL